MNDRQREALIRLGTDVDGAIYRFGGNEGIYVSCLQVFLEDDSMCTLRDAFAAKDRETAITAVHTLKGTAGNMGFVPLMQAAQRTLDLLRAGQYGEAEAALALLERAYRSTTEGIRQILLMPISE